MAPFPFLVVAFLQKNRLGRDGPCSFVRSRGDLCTLVFTAVACRRGLVQNVREQTLGAWEFPAMNGGTSPLA